ncbi:GTPase IMAP family member 9-like [Garra rufa]|uniref:GTPase IMAP family member 9-like n=1 Tax=Garra rufa TaxID=137080 RepID=UPI003CCE65C5
MEAMFGLTPGVDQNIVYVDDEVVKELPEYLLDKSHFKLEQSEMESNSNNNTESVKELKIISVGKTGTGKSHSGNTILCDTNAFGTKRSSKSVTQTCQTGTATVNGRTITYIDTPGFFDTRCSEEQLRSEILKSIVKCAPGPHAFLILLKVDTYTGQEEEIVKKITETFGEVALKQAVVLFTHGDDLDEGQTIEEFVSENSELQKLVDKCGGRCHVIDNKYWNQQEEDEYRNNKVAIQKLIKNIDKMVRENGGRCYSNEMLEEVQRNIDNEMENIKAANDSWADKQIRDKAEENVCTKFKVRLAGIATGILLGALLGVLDSLQIVIKCLYSREDNSADAERIIYKTIDRAKEGAKIGYNAHQFDPVHCQIDTLLESLQSRFSAGLTHSTLTVYVAALLAYHHLSVPVSG